MNLETEILEELSEFTEEDSELLHPSAGSQRKLSHKRFNDFYEEYNNIKQKRKNQGHEDYSLNRRIKRGEV